MWDGRQLLPATWVEAATSLQVANGSDPHSDWSQGYGYQFWRSRHDSYRGDGAFGQYCIVIPGQDVVIAITSGVADMQAVMDLVFARLLPAMRAAPLPEDPPAETALRERLAGLSIRPVAGQETSPIADRIAGKRFHFEQNELGLESILFELDDGAVSMRVRTTQGSHRMAIRAAGWAPGRSDFAFGLEGTPGLTDAPLAVAANGAWQQTIPMRSNVCAVRNAVLHLTRVPFRWRCAASAGRAACRVRAEAGSVSGGSTAHQRPGTGFRFSRKAFTPSSKSSLWNMPAR